MDGQCDSTEAKEVAATVSDFTDVAQGSVKGLINAVNVAPVSIAVDAEEW